MKSSTATRNPNIDEIVREVARAETMAERERCANLALHYPLTGLFGGVENFGDQYEALQLAIDSIRQDIASSIRNGNAVIAGVLDD